MKRDVLPLRVLLDELFPGALREELLAHEATTVTQAEWAGLVAHRREFVTTTSARFYCIAQ
ncbi:MAG: hypothetical protein ACTS6J_14170 [Burkholderiales bacterium]